MQTIAKNVKDMSDEELLNRVKTEGLYPEYRTILVANEYKTNTLSEIPSNYYLVTVDHSRKAQIVYRNVHRKDIYMAKILASFKPSAFIGRLNEIYDEKNTIQWPKNS